jgi:transcriptional regulator with PAS, ATPase and Fis domain
MSYNWHHCNQKLDAPTLGKYIRLTQSPITSPSYARLSHDFRVTAPRIAVVSAAESFCEVWPQLARVAGATLEVSPTVGEIRSIQSACGVIVSVGGSEDAAVPILRELRSSRAPDSVVVGTDTNYRAVASILQAGASDYYAFPGDVVLCRGWMVERVEAVENRRNGERFAAEERERFDFSKLIGKSPLLRTALNRTSKVIPRGTATILISGETGTGKELLARAVHFNGKRATGPLVEINCTTLPENLLEAELFGYEPGAFTDARGSKPGLFEVAHGGTLFLDEIGDLGVALQAKLLRVLEEKRVRRLGSVREVDIDLRIIAATNVDLPSAVRAGEFRQDLYYRLNVVPIRLPPLRERGEDVMLLADHFLDVFSDKYAVRRPPITPDIKRALKDHDWPGNVRELRNSIERAVLLGDGNLFVEDLFPDETPTTNSNGVLPFPASMYAIERAAAAAMVARCAGNKSEAAKALGVSRKHLYTLLGPGGT